MSEQDNISDKELGKEAPLLFGIEKEEYKVPEGYFDTLADKLIAKVEEESTFIVRMNSNRTFYWSIAAGIALVFGLFTVIGTFTESTENQKELTELNIDYDQDLEYLLAIDEDIILDVYLESDDQTDSDQTIDYLMDEGIEYEELLNVDL